MKQTGFFHHIGSFLLLVATILLIVTCISAPVVRDISMLKVTLEDNGNLQHPMVTFGTFGYCIQNALASGDFCSRAGIGYRPADVLAEANSQFEVSQATADTANSLTKVMVLHAVAAGTTFIAFLLALGAGVVGSLLAALVAVLTFLITLVVLVTDFVSFALLKNAVNSANNGASAEFGSAMWTILVSCICNLLAAIIVFFTCCSARLHNKRGHTSHKTERYDSPPVHHTASSRRRGWF